jgi:Caspase domain/Bacterial Ig domain
MLKKIGIICICGILCMSQASIRTFQNYGDLRIALSDASIPVIKWEMPKQASSLVDVENIFIKAYITSRFPIMNVKLVLNNVDQSVGKEIVLINKENSIYVLFKAITLREGENILYITAQNEGGTNSSERRTIIYKAAIPPVITWQYPFSTKSTIDQTSIKIKASIQSKAKLQSITLNVNGKSADIGDFKPTSDTLGVYVVEHDIQLRSGENIVNIMASNAAGNVISSDLNIACKDIPGPSIKWDNPSSPLTVVNKEAVFIRANITSRIALKTVRLHINDSIQLITDIVLINKEKGIYALFKGITVNEGDNNIYISAENESGPNSSEKRVITYKPALPPVITWLYPYSAKSTFDQTGIKIKALIESSTKIESLTLNVNGIASGTTANIKATSDTTKFILEHEVQLNPGENIIDIMASNIAGNVISTDISISRKEIAGPVIKWESPEMSSYLVNEKSVFVKASIFSKIGLKNVRLNLNDSDHIINNLVLTNKEKGQYTMFIGVTLHEGENYLYITAQNESGPNSSDRRTIIYKAIAPPVITWQYPLTAKSTIDQTNTKIKATIISKVKLQSLTVNVNGIPSEKLDLKPTSDTTKYTLEREIQLKPGDNSVNIMAANIGGNTLSTDIVITYRPPSPPSITWELPAAARTETNAPTASISAKINSVPELTDVKIFVNNLEIIGENKFKIINKDNGDYLMESNIALKKGENNVFILASNLNGIKRSDESRVIIYNSNQAPVIRWNNPQQMSTMVNSENYMLDVCINSASAIKSVQLYVNGNPQASETVFQTISKDFCSFSWKPSAILKEGENTIYIIADNASGSIRSEKRLLSFKTSETMASRNLQKILEVPEKQDSLVKKDSLRKNAPIITWISPSKPSTELNNQYSGRIKASIKSFEKPSSVLFYFNEIATEEYELKPFPGSGNEYTFEKTIIFQPGENNFYLVATNSLGSNKSEIRSMVNPPDQLPVVNWMRPGIHSSIVNTESFIIEVCIKSVSDLKSAKLLVNGEVQANDKIFKRSNLEQCSYEWKKQVILKEGDNSIYIIAENGAGTQPSENVVIKMEKALAEKRLALIFGNSDYGDTRSLKNPANDANLMEATLKDLGFDIIKRINATKSDMNKAIQEFSVKLPDYNVALFYYAGHGVQVDGTNYLVPVDAVLKEKSDCKFDAISVNFVVEEFEKFPGNTNIVILDACRENPFRSWVRGGDAGFKPINPSSGTIISFATNAGSTAADGKGPNGLFTEELVKEMMIPQPIESVFKKTRVQVQKKSNGAQIPQEWSMLNGEFFFKK